MLIRRTSPFTNIIHDWDIDVTEEQLKRWRQGTLIQNAMPNLTDNEREFIKTGITPQEWADTFKDEENA